MTPGDIQGLRKHYREMTEALERVRLKELRALTPEGARKQMRALKSAGEPWRARRDWSGLVEQQAIFHSIPVDE